VKVRIRSISISHPNPPCFYCRFTIFNSVIIHSLAEMLTALETRNVLVEGFSTALRAAIFYG
jgi:hypothetical protein